MITLKNFTPRVSLALTFSALLLPGLSALTGCGGGGTAAPGPIAPAAPRDVTLTGTLQNLDGSPMAGYRVVYAPAAAPAVRSRQAHADSSELSTITDSQGRYALVIPAAKVLPQATLSFYAPSGDLAQTQTVTLDSTGGMQSTVTTISVPPAPPADLN